ncbi:50S ribosomal protein L25, partial [Patescibacteria group bacterium]
MLTLSVKIRKTLGKKVRDLRKKGVLPAVLYGPKIKNLSLEVDLKEFEKVYQEAGKSSLVSLEVDGKKALVLIHEVKLDPLNLKPTHVDFYQPILLKKVEVKVPLVFEGEALAVKELGGTLVKNISEVEIKGLPQNLPKEIKVQVENLKTFEDYVLIKDLQLREGVEVLKDPNEIVASIAPPKKEEELEKPIEEKVEEVERVGEKKE